MLGERLQRESRKDLYVSIEDDIRSMIDAKRREDEVALERQRQEKAALELDAINYSRKLNQVLRDIAIGTFTRASDELQAHHLVAEVSHSFVVETALIDNVMLSFYNPSKSAKTVFIRYVGNAQRQLVFVETGSSPVDRTDPYKTFKSVRLDAITTTTVEEHLKAFIRAVLRMNEII